MLLCFLSDSIVERKGDRVTIAFEYIYSGERIDASGAPLALMMTGQLPVHWAFRARERESVLQGSRNQ